MLMKAVISPGFTSLTRGASALSLTRHRCINIPVRPGGGSSSASKSKKTDKKAQNHGRPSYRFVDRTRVRVQGGSGGKGCLSMHRLSGRGFKRRADGGHGGRGGNVIIVADPNEQSLKWSHPHVRAESGAHGGSQEMNGRNGENLILKVPCGVVVRRILDYREEWDPVNQVVRKIQPDGYDDGEAVVDDQGVEFIFEPGVQRPDREDDIIPLDLTSDDAKASASSEDAVVSEADWMSSEFSETVYPERESVVLADLDKPGSHVVVARGGAGGYGNCTLATRGGPIDLQQQALRAKAGEGETAFLELELKLIADIALVGFPNAGKSSLLAAMSRATPEIAPYPFTTLHPLVGCIEYKDGFRVMVADIPGLIQGASEGRGRGHAFLRHVERTKALLYIVDAAGVDGRHPEEDLVTLTDELSSYGDGDLMNRPALILANKIDLLNDDKREGILHDLGEAAEKAGICSEEPVFGISAGVTGDGLGPLSRAIRKLVIQCDEDRAALEEMTANDY